MKTPIEIASEVIFDMPTSVLSAEELKGLILDFLQHNLMKHEREHLTLAFKDGQSRPLQMHTEWFKKRYGQTERTGESE
jgi:hypothetical protein